MILCIKSRPQLDKSYAFEAEEGEDKKKEGGKKEIYAKKIEGRERDGVYSVLMRVQGCCGGTEDTVEEPRSL